MLDCSSPPLSLQQAAHGLSHAGERGADAQRSRTHYTSDVAGKHTILAHRASGRRLFDRGLRTTSWRLHSSAQPSEHVRLQDESTCSYPLGKIVKNRSGADKIAGSAPSGHFAVGDVVQREGETARWKCDAKTDMCCE